MAFDDLVIESSVLWCHHVFMLHPCLAYTDISNVTFEDYAGCLKDVY